MVKDALCFKFILLLKKYPVFKESFSLLLFPEDLSLYIMPAHMVTMKLQSCWLNMVPLSM